MDKATRENLVSWGWCCAVVSAFWGVVYVWFMR